MAEFIYTMKKVRKAHGDKVILDDVTLNFLPGAKIGVVGPNGAGKSSVLKIMAGLDKANNGDAFLATGASVGILMQEPQLDESKTVRENVEEGVPIKGKLNREERGEWHFSWILEGRGIQDVWIVPPRVERSGGADLYEYGTSLRFYDPALKAWQSTWIGPMHQVVRTFIARKIGEQIILETTEGETPRMRWSFSDIQTNSFSWRNELWTGSAWRTQQTFVARRSSTG